MNIFSKADSGVIPYKSFFNRSHKVIADISIGKLVPISAEFGMPGDIWKLNNTIFIRTQSMLAPLLTDLTFRMRYFFVPLRLLDENTELIITGTKNGHYKSDTVIPSFPGMFDNATNYNVAKYSVLDYMLGMPIGNYANIKTQDCIPAQYWFDAYSRVWFDWYRDENLRADDDFATYNASLHSDIGNVQCYSSNWRKDYFTSALPFQQKGITPTLDLSLVNPDTGTNIFTSEPGSGFVSTSEGDVEPHFSDTSPYLFMGTSSGVNGKPLSTVVDIDFTNAGISFNTTDLRLMVQTQRIFERLARTGSRYTEYLLSNFGTSPKDETLQRAQYLGGFTQPIVVSEVAQTGQDSVTSGGTTTQFPVGTLRGKGVSLGNSSLENFVCKEFGVILGICEVMPKATYTQGINRQFTYKNRFDFVNPSFCNLSEQEIRNGEVYIDFNATETVGGETVDNQNDETFGFTEMYNELRISNDRVCGDMRDTQNYWTMARYFSSRPNLNDTFVRAKDDFSNPFAVTDKPPIILECGNNHKVWRCLPKYSTPGLVDHS